MISVITRTQNRRLFLPRVYRSLKVQNYRPIEWIIVNDAGESLTELIDGFQKDCDDTFHIKYIEKKSSTTMEAATNVGIKASNGTYIHILDDDDTIAEGFYDDALKQFKTLHIDSLGGIICYSSYVYEQVNTDNEIRHIRTEDFPLKPTHITIPAMLRQNQFPVHAFIYKKSILEKVGYYDESLPVLGDWDFNLRFLQHYDIVVLPKQYAFYHKRIDAQYANSVQSDLNSFFIYEAVIKNKIIRKYYDKSLPALLGQSENSQLILDLFQTDITHKNSEIANFHAKIGQLETTVHEKNLTITALQDDKDKILGSLDKLLRDKDNHISNMEQVLKDQEEKLQVQESVILQKDNHISNMEQVLKDQEEKLQVQESIILQYKIKEEKLNTYLAIFKETMTDAIAPIEKDTRKFTQYLLPVFNIFKIKQLRKKIYRMHRNLNKLNRVNSDLLDALDIKNYDLSELPTQNIKKKLEHFVFFGYEEVRLGQRKLHVDLPKMSEMNYIDTFEDIKNAVKQGQLDSAYTHFLLHGANEMLSGARSIPKINTYTYVAPVFTEAIEKELKNFTHTPLISIVIPVYNVDVKWLELAINSIKAQWYTRWEICIADDKSSKQETLEYLSSIDDPKIHILFLEKNVNISGASNAALSLANGEYIALMDNDDELTPDALYEVVRTINEKESEFIYSDEDKLELDGTYSDPHFKADFAPDMFLSQNYLSHLAVIKKTLIQKVGGWELGLEGSQDYDLYLKILEHTDKIAHIPKVLYHWRKVPGSTATQFSGKSYAHDAGRKALKNAIKRRHLNAKAQNGKYPGTYRVRYAIDGKPLISIIIPFKDKPELLDMCINSILKKSTYKNYEIIGMSNNSDEPETFEMMKELSAKDERVNFYEYNEPFNFSAINNYAVAHYAKGQHIILLNNDIEIITPEWIESMLEFSQREDVGAVGAKLYYPNDTIQHAGVIIGIGGVGGHAHKHFQKEETGYFSRLHIIQNLSAVTAACLMIKKSVYRQLNGLNEKDLKIAFNDVDFCLRLREKGYLNVYTPYCEAYHHESISRGAEDNPEKVARFNSEVAYMQKRHKNILIQGDPYYNIKLTIDHEDFSLKVK